MFMGDVPTVLNNTIYNTCTLYKLHGCHEECIRKYLLTAVKLTVFWRPFAFFDEFLFLLSNGVHSHLLHMEISVYRCEYIGMYSSFLQNHSQALCGASIPGSPLFHSGRRSSHSCLDLKHTSKTLAT